jgi:hypothetical protein
MTKTRQPSTDAPPRWRREAIRALRSVSKLVSDDELAASAAPESKKTGATPRPAIAAAAPHGIPKGQPRSGRTNAAATRTAPKPDASTPKPTTPQQPPPCETVSTSEPGKKSSGPPSSSSHPTAGESKPSSPTWPERKEESLWQQNLQLVCERNILLLRVEKLEAEASTAADPQVRAIRQQLVAELARLLPVAVRRAREKRGSPALLRLICRAIKTL